MVAEHMEIDGSLRTNMKRMFSYKNRNVADGKLHEGTDEPEVFTPPQGTRVPARLRLSVSTKQMEVYGGAAQEPQGDESSVAKRKRALFDPVTSRSFPNVDGLLPPPDFEATSYPQGWVIGKKRKLVNVDVVESMRRIAVHEMNRKDREIDGLNEQLKEDSRTMQLLQLQLQQEKSKRLQAERENTLLHGQITMLMNMIDEGEAVDPLNHES
ncbi:hypothetical protein O6H91_05G016800 [Diphasiastrum complanatum]|uniref:Uncharacterized protein n=1 Tax=Diphasiastrum complanatum TaxID=34168 RepID=A0ACC2DL36_DIPCM|nr:hypothetical protein O6H91_05G016800 [Diphasiastrum complanatum]